mmetsp:Transcript_46252/g.92326  ORF Transcript_46252/g.92326 Transcript_46252/m.92326 type:complete len:98 (-) Transcript_46252:422-715(-)
MPESAAAVSEKDDMGVRTVALLMLTINNSIIARLAPSRVLLPSDPRLERDGRYTRARPPSLAATGRSAINQEINHTRSPSLAAAGTDQSINHPRPPS